MFVFEGNKGNYKFNELIIVDTPDVLMICKKDKEQSIKEYVAEVKRNIGDHFV
ncbi:MAG: hypothetical protein FYV88_5140 [Bacteroidetes bacterium]|nr:hypothetical protein [Bacteroidota bacterium]